MWILVLFTEWNKLNKEALASFVSLLWWALSLWKIHQISLLKNNLLFGFQRLASKTLQVPTCVLCVVLEMGWRGGKYGEKLAQTCVAMCECSYPQTNMTQLKSNIFFLNCFCAYTCLKSCMLQLFYVIPQQVPNRADKSRIYTLFFAATIIVDCCWAACWCGNVVRITDFMLETYCM